MAAISDWSDIRMAMRYTHAMEDEKRRSVEAFAQRHSAIEVQVPTLPGESTCGPSKRVHNSITIVLGNRLHDNLRDKRKRQAIGPWGLRFGSRNTRRE
jgi:hypothetical protein